MYKRPPLEGEVRIPSGCAISAVISKDGNRFCGEGIIKSMIPMHDRSNGLGGGFAAYGIYPDYKEFYAFHIFYNDNSDRIACENFLKDGFEIVKVENIPIKKIPEITNVPLIWRYFVAPLSSVLTAWRHEIMELMGGMGINSIEALRGNRLMLRGINLTEKELEILGISHAGE